MQGWTDVIPKPCDSYFQILAMQILAGAGPFVATLMANQTAVHAIPAAINRLTEALLGSVGAEGAHVRVVNNPMPEVPGELSVMIQETAGAWLRCHLCLVLSICSVTHINVLGQRYMDLGPCNCLLR